MGGTYLVTGANRGIGLELAKQLIARGDSVVATARDAARATELAATGARVVTLDVGNDGSIDELGKRLEGRPIDVLINNAGVSSEAKTLADQTGTELRRVFFVNSIAPVLVTRALIGNLRAGSRRVIVNVSSQLASIRNNTGGSSYSYRSSKAALNMLTVSMANELRPDKFICIALHPGWVRTDMGGPQAPLTAESSVAAMLKLVDSLTPRHSGKFLSFDGSEIPW